MGLKKLFMLSCVLAFVFIGLMLLIDTGIAGFESTQSQDELIPSALFVESDIRLIHAFRGERADASDSYGWVGANVGDLNDDGSSEFLVSAPTYSDTFVNQGRVYLYSGRDGSVLHTVTGPVTGTQTGYSVTGAGDIDQDDIPDYGIASPGTIGVPGRVQIFSGKDNSEIYNLTGNAGGFGRDIDAGMDVNQDSYPDIIVGAEFETTELTQTGRVYLFSGQDGEILWTRNGENTGDQLGGGLGFVDDVNNDAIPDVVAAARGANGGSGRAYVFSGTDGSIIHTLEPTEPLSNTTTFGRFFAFGAGDIDNDGTSDIFIGDYAAVGGAGRVYIYSGVDGSLLRTIEAEEGIDGVGPGRGIGDVNGDAVDDLIYAAYTFNGAATSGGKIYISSGADGSILHTVTSKVPNLFLGVDALRLDDLNNDGFPDYLITGFGQAYVVSFGSNTYLPLVQR